MAQMIRFDDGVKEFDVNGKSTLRFNPSDPNVYGRFSAMQDKLLEVEKWLETEGRKLPTAPADATPEQLCDSGKAMLNLLYKADLRVKALLDEVFPESDFEKVFDGVNLMAVADNGERVVTNFLMALVPIIQDGMQAYTDSKVQQALGTPVQHTVTPFPGGGNRAQRRKKRKKGGR